MRCIASLALALTVVGCKEEAKPDLARREATASSPLVESDPAAAAASILKQAQLAVSAAAQEMDAASAMPPCEQAYAELMALVESVKTAAGHSSAPPAKGAAEGELPTRQSFLETCNSLPEEVQRCMKLGHAMANTAACKSKIDALPSDLRAKTKVLRPPAGN